MFRFKVEDHYKKTKDTFGIIIIKFNNLKIKIKLITVYKRF